MRNISYFRHSNNVELAAESTTTSLEKVEKWEKQIGDSYETNFVNFVKIYEKLVLRKFHGRDFGENRFSRNLSKIITTTVPTARIKEIYQIS